MEIAANWARTALTPLVAAALFGSACGNPGPDIDLVAREYALDIEPATTEAGTVRIAIDNVGDLRHELILVRATEPEDLPLVVSGAVDLAKVQVVDRVPEFEPGLYETKLPAVPAGQYVLFCNLIGSRDGEATAHFSAGMRTSLEVRPDPDDELPR